MKKRLAIALIMTLTFSANLFASTPIRIDIEKTREPISKYIYGQFIEHLGRCIYGGIWAEMLEDRKFYYPITYEFNPWATASDPFWNTGEYRYLNASPWKVIGPPNTVSMDSTKAYVGVHSPIIKLPGNGTTAGFSQDGLAVLKNKKYTGRIILSGDNSATPVLIRLVLDDDTVLTHQIQELSSEYQRSDFTFEAPRSSDNVRLEIVSSGNGQMRIGTVSLMPVNNLKGWRPDVIDLLKQLASPVYRWPGGNFVSGYNWRDGIGERDKRPPRKNPAWKGVEHNDVGIHEYMELMELIDSEAFIAVNTGLGTVEEVAEEVEYCNGSIETEMGKLRAENGHPEPYNVRWWAVGNEMYGEWQLGHMPLENYVKKHIRVAKAMWQVDPNIKLIGVGSVGKWSETMLKECADYMNLISEHIYCREKSEVTEHIKQLSQEIIRKTDAHRQYRKEINGLAEKDIRIAMDEWNFWYGDYIYGELGVRYHLKDALGVAMGLHEFFRNSDLYHMANYAQTVNVIGCIKTTRTAAAFATTGLPLKLYRHHFGTIPVAVSHSSPDLDIAAALSEDRQIISIAVINPTDKNKQVQLDFWKTSVESGAEMWVIHQQDPEAYNEPGKAPEVVIQEKEISLPDKELTIPAFSNVMVRFKIK
jgi:alpha-N-arabinofuranosidase